MLETNKCLSIDLESLPSPPGIAVRLLELFQAEEVDKDELAMVIGADLALTAKIIRYCNSPMFGRATQINSLGHAIVALGLKKVRMIALSFSLVEFKSDGDNGIDFDKFWNRSLATAVSTQVVCDAAGENGEMGFLTGLILNVGEILMRLNLGELSELEVCSDLSVENIVRVEQEHYGINRFEIGCTLLESWSFPESIVNIIRSFLLDEKQPELNRCIDLGSQIAGMFFADEVDLEAIDRIQGFANEQISNEFDINEAFDSANEKWIEFSKLLEFESSSPNCLRVLEQKARDKIVALSLAQVDEHQMIQRENETLSWKVHTDELTGLQNRRSFEHFLDIEFERALRGNNLTIAMIDIDRFKSVNDTYGHLVGDEALKHVSAVLDDNVRKSDILCRYGGEEFVVLMSGCKVSNALVVCERIRQMVESSEFLSEGKRLPMTVSIGIAAFELQDSITDRKQLLEIADQNLYQAKENGRNCCIW